MCFSTGVCVYTNLQQNILNIRYDHKFHNRFLLANSGLFLVGRGMLREFSRNLYLSGFEKYNVPEQFCTIIRQHKDKRQDFLSSFLRQIHFERSTDGLKTCKTHRHKILLNTTTQTQSQKHLRFHSNILTFVDFYRW